MEYVVSNLNKPKKDYPPFYFQLGLKGNIQKMQGRNESIKRLFWYTNALILLELVMYIRHVQEKGSADFLSSSTM